MAEEAQRLNSSAVSYLQTWIGKCETREDEITAFPAEALSATLDRDDPFPGRGSPLPPLWHWLYFLSHHRTSEIGRDGHVRRGEFLPPVELPRRMWAGGRLWWQMANCLRIGDSVQRTSRIKAVTHKSGRSGDLLFVTVAHELHNVNGLALTEEQDIVYRAMPQRVETSPALITAATDATWQRELTPDEILLFRYSALTFNSHRIHFDRRYASEFEGYSGLVVHGPLIATLLLDLLRRNIRNGPVWHFDFRAIRPAFSDRLLQLNGRPGLDRSTIALSSQDDEGRLTMTATAELAT